MAIGGSGKNVFESRKLQQRQQVRRKAQARRMLLESLEARQLMAVGPQLIGIQPNEGSLLEDGQTRNVAPKELVLRFDDQVALDANTLSGIQLVRSGGDGFFERATVSSDLGSNNGVVLSFTAAVAGVSGNGIQLAFTSVNRTDSSAARISVSNRTISLELNNNPLLTSTAQDVINAIDNSSAARQLISVTRLRGSAFTPVGGTASGVSPLTLAGANVAGAVTNLNAGTNLQVQILAQQAGTAGRNVRVQVTTRDRGVGVAPGVTVNGTIVSVELNSNISTPTTASGFINALNGNPASAALVQARLVSGLGTTVVGNRAINYSPLLLTGGSDVPIVPAYIGLGSTDREVVLRFGETLPDDLYRLEILGNGNAALRNARGEAFNGGVSRSIEFSLDLGARIQAIVPQPVTRDPSTNLLSQERNRIDVYFNDDDLNTALATNVNFYQLVYTAGTGTNTDDVVFTPTRVEYNAVTDRAAVFFARNLDRLVHPITGVDLPISELRLRIGSNDSIPSAPSTLTPAADAGSSFATALNVSGNWSPSASTSASLQITSEIRNATPYVLDFPGGNDEPGNRDIRPQTHLFDSADSIDGITVFQYNFQPVLGSINNTLMVNAITEQQKVRTREVLELLSQYMGVRFVETDNLGLTLAVGDLRAVDGLSLNSPNGQLGVAGQLRSSGQAAAVLDIQDFGSSLVNEFGGEFFLKMMQSVGFLLGLGTADELPALTVQSNVVPAAGTEMVFPGDHDIVHGRFLYRPDSTDIDLYTFTLPASGRVTIEAFAERLSNSSLLDTQLRLYQLQSDGSFREVAQNDDYFSEDSLISMELVAGTYVLGVSASGNNDYNPVIADTGIGGTSEGQYQVRIDFRPPASAVLRDSTGVALDGDADGVPGGVHNFWFRPTGPSNTLFVDKAASAGGNGSLITPFRNISDAITEANRLGSVIEAIRVVGNGGADGRIETPADNLAYEIGFNALNQPLPDGTTLDVPKDVALMIDAGAVLKLRRARVGIGSTSVLVDRSGSSLQVLGTPRLISNTGAILVDSVGLPVTGSVFFTSLHDKTIGRDTNADRFPPAVAPGDWGGLDFRNRVDATDASRTNLERDALFMNSLTFADIRFGGGQVIVDGNSQVIAPVSMVDARPTVAYSSISRSADAAMSATPNSFLESNFQDPQSQVTGLYSSDVRRVGPAIVGNTLSNNSINGLFVRVSTGQQSAQTENLTVTARFDDTDIVHVLTENLTIAGTAGGAVLNGTSPSTVLVVLGGQAGGTLTAGTYRYRLTFVDASGNESLVSEDTQAYTLGAGEGRIALSNLPIVPSGSGFVSRRLYRSDATGTGNFVLAAILNANATNFVDSGSTIGGGLPTATTSLRARLDASLTVDPGTVVKLQGSRIEVGIGAQMIAEGRDGHSVVFTSLDDVRYGGSGTFSTVSRATPRTPVAGDWGGIVSLQASSLSLDHANIAFGGGTTRIEGGFAGFNAVEIHQADARITNTKLENNAAGTLGTTDADRAGRGMNSDASIFVRGAQPIIIGNTITNGTGPAISINANALNSDIVRDSGRSTGGLGAYSQYGSNQGALVRENRLGNNALNGMQVRGQELTTQSVWDDTDIVHILQNEVLVTNLHAFGGLRLESSANGSLVVKLQGASAGFTASGLELDIDDRIGGSVQLVGQPGFPVILTSLSDDSVGAGFNPEGIAQNDTDNNGSSGGGVSRLPTGPEVDNGTLIDNDVNVFTPGAFSFRAGAGGQSGFATADGFGGGITATGNSQPFVNTDAIFEFLNYIDIGGNGGALNLSNTTITTPPTLVAPDLVISSGTFTGANGNTIRWTVESRMDNGIATVFNTLILDSDSALGDITFINYLDEDILGAFDDLLYVTGTPGTADFRAFTLDGPERIGFSQGGFFTAGDNLQNASYIGWAADRYPQLQTAITGTGTTYSLAGNIDTGDLVPFNDPTLGTVYGLADITTAFAWRVDPTARSARMTSFLELVPRDPSTGGRSGDWRSVRLETLSNDRNVQAITETESATAGAPGPNSAPSSAQYLGRLAANLTSGDENQRLGFEVHGVLSQGRDLDVYSFSGKAGAEVWLDIDRTTSSLDTVLELVDANGNILALSNDSFAEELDNSLLYRNPSMPSNSVQPLRKSPLALYPTSAQDQAKDLYSTNIRDAGMRVILPGQPGTENVYHVRVRSSSLATGGTTADLLTANSLNSGLTSGNYQLQIRLREVDEFPGSSINYADIRFATTGMEVLGLPKHSPLVGELGEVENGQDPTLGNAQNVGNLLSTDRQAISLAGDLATASDVDWYQFDLTYQSISPTGLINYFSTVFDIDYADGLGLPNTSMYIFDSQGRLILSGLNSNVADDRGTAYDLAGGSAGTQDPYIGTVELPEGQYFLAISNTSRQPNVLNNPLVRLQPVSGSRLIARDHIDTPALLPSETPITNLFNPATSVVPYSLGDVVMYVSQDVGFQVTNLYMVNPFSGRVTNTVGRFNFDVQDIGMRFNGTLRAFDLPFSNTGADLDGLADYIDINPGTAIAGDIGDLGIQTFRTDGAGAVQDANVGFYVEAITFTEIGGQERGFIVGNRPVTPGPAYFSNVLYEFDENSGAATSAPAANRADTARVQGAGTDIRERGYIETSPIGIAVSRQMVTSEATRVDADRTTTTLIADGRRFQVATPSGTNLTFEMNTGPEFTITYDPASGRNVRDGDRFEVNGQIYEFDTGPVVVIDAATGASLSAGSSVRIVDNFNVIRTFEFTQTGSVASGNIPVLYTAAQTQTELVASLIAAINAQTGFAVRASTVSGGNRISLTNTSSSATATVSGTGMTVSGSPGNSVGLSVPIEENSTLVQFIDAIQRAVGNNVTVSVDGDRLNFSGAVSAQVTDLVNRGILTARTGNSAVAPGAIPVNFLANDDAADIAARIARAINGAGVVGLSASVNGSDVLVSGGNFVNADTPFRLAGVAPGGTVTGIAVVNGDLFAVSDRGGLYRVGNPTGVNNGNVATYVSTASDLLGIQFSGLSAGPVRLSNGEFAEVLFGTDSFGRIFAFDTSGDLLPIFAGGATSVATGLFNLNGVTFAPLDYNLWHESNNRSGNLGHGLPALPDGTRNAVPGNTSYYFGFESPAANNAAYTTVSQPGFTNSYNFAGGAQGVLLSNPFDLSGIGADDQPTLYFNYFLATEGANSDLNDLDPMLDSFRVYAGGEDGVWQLLTTNNSERGPGLADDELDVPNSQETFDNTGVWRQARVNLGDFAGQENVRLRIEFSTAGSFGYGAQGGRGPEIRLVGGDRVRDGQTVTVNGVDFEIEMGTTLVIPAGSALQDGDSITIDGQRFVFDSNGAGVSAPDIAVPFTATETSDVIAQRLLTLVEANFAAKPSITGLNFTAETNDTLTTATRTTITGDSITVSGTGNIGDNPLLITTPSADIDLVRMQLSYGASVTVTATATGALTLNPMLRIFDANGVEIAANDNFAGLNARVTFTAPADGLYYIGVSGSGNNAYNPAVFGTGVASSIGDYRLDIDVTRLLDAEVVDNRLQLLGAANVSVTPGSAIVVEGSMGTAGLPVFIQSNMTADEVGQALRQAIANALTGGATSVMNIFADTMDMTGFNVSSSGPFGLTSFLFGDAFGGYNSSTQFDGSRNAQFPGALRAQNNNFEGVYVDDFIIGTIERGEMVVSATPDTSFTPSNPVGNDILVGPYQLEIRGGSSRGLEISASVPSFLYTEIYEPNQRTAPGTSITFNSAISLVDGATFSLSDGVNTVVFEFEDEVVGNGVTSGRIPVPYNAMFNSVTNSNTAETAAIIAARVRDLINGQLVQSLIKVRANLSNGDLTGATSDTIDLFGTVTAVVPTEVGTAVVTTGTGDVNRDRDQGQVVIQNSRISNSSGFGIEIDTNSRAAVTNASNPGTTRNTVVQNSLRQIPGVVVMNNELVSNTSGGIRMVGATDTATTPAASVPVARVVNNTIVGGIITTPSAPASATFGGQFFAQGSIAFADAVTSYDPNFSGGPAPIASLQVAANALGTPNYTGTGEPVGNDNVVSLGRGGRLVVQFTNNRLTGSGDSKPDLMIFEVGSSELVTVEVSTDGVTYTNVGMASGAFPTIDLDSYGFTPSSRLQFVRLTDVVTDGATSGDSVGADIDAVGAISSVQLDTYSPRGNGLVIENNVSPTLLNNVLVNNANGIAFINTTPSNTVLGGTVYQLNTNNLSGSTNLGQFSTVVAASTPMFVSPGTGNFYPAANSPLVDTAVDSLQDRPNMVAVKQGLGIPASPVLAPDYDRNGLLRVNSSSGGGVGNNVFKDRGSLDRADSVRPSVTLLNPLDNDAAGLDSNSENTVVELTNVTLNYFDIQLFDGSGLADGNRGSNIDDSTVTSHSFVVYKDRVPLVEGIDYRFGYDATNNVIRLTPLAGVWELDAVYQVRFLNSSQTVIQAQPAVSYSDATKIQIVGSDGISKTLEIDMGLIIAIPSTTTGTASIDDGDTLVLDDGSRRRTFEFDSNNSISGGNIRVAFNSSSTAQDVAQALINAITANGMAFTPVAIGAGRVQLHSAVPSFASTTSTIGITGATGVTPNFGLQIPLAGGVPIGLDDGETFVISRGTQSVTFEIDYNNSVVSGNRAVRLVIGQSAAAVGAALVTAIANAGLGLTPTYTGAGLVELGPQADIVLNLSQTDLRQVGQAGVPGSIRVTLNATAANDATAVAVILASAINNAAITGVSAIAIGSEVLIQGATGVVGSSTTAANPIKDLAGNTLSPNQTTGETTLTIFLGQGFDYGDAPDPTYPTRGDSNGARHTVVNGYSLGTLNNADADARLVDADNDDGVSIVPVPGSGINTPTVGFATRIIVTAQGITASRPGLLNAWIDFNGNGSFDSNERIFNNVSLVNGTNILTTPPIEPTAAIGETWARFRLSSAAVSTPFGAAADGEVEDYRLTISANPYQNSTNRFDVSGDGFVSAIDALQLINFLNRNNGFQPLPLPPGMVAPRFPNVNGDGVINTMDALNVINYLNSRPAGEGEAEGEGNDSELFGLSRLMAGANLSATPITPATRNYTELRLGDFLHLSSAAPMGPAATANAWWDESELVSEGFVDALAGAYSSEFTDSHDELFADLELDL